MSKNLITLETKLSTVNFVAPKFLQKLKNLNIETVRDLLWHFPARYEDYATVSSIESLSVNDQATIKAEVKNTRLFKIQSRRLTVFEAIVNDGTSGITLVWFNQPFIGKTIRIGTVANFAGKVTASKRGGLQMTNPKFEIPNQEDPTHTAGIIAVYPETKGLTSKGIRYLIKNFLQVLKIKEDFLPEKILREQKLPTIDKALQYLHAPKDKTQIEKAQKRFSFEYLFLIQLTNLLTRSTLSRYKAPKLAVSKREEDELLKSLPFTLTKDQKNTLEEILADIKKEKPMNRLVQGDVGSGKTIVAVIASLIAADSEHQSVFMAPTEVLAAQHYQTMCKLFPDFEKGIALLTGAQARVSFGKNLEKETAKANLKKLIEKDSVKIIIGTHSLISSSKKTKPLTIPSLGLAIIDEQHRFGKDQRAALSKSRKKGKELPHFLSMSATPIPRTLTLTLFGDLDLSTINELPKGRKPIITKIVDPENRGKAYNFIRQNIEKGRQAFFIIPRIEKSESSEESTWAKVKTVKEEFQFLSEKIFPDLKLAMLHGKMKSEEKKKVMDAFSKGKIDILVSTSVIEVGVDVPNASVMVIEGAERFGLSQLYQFKGRVGRGEHQSFCLLFTSHHTSTNHARLQALVDAKNGFDLAQKDLEMRGPGEFFGDKQTGLPDVAMSALTDARLVKKAGLAAKNLLLEDPSLKEHQDLRTKLIATNKRIHFE